MIPSASRILSALLLTACSALTPAVDVILDTTPEPAAAAAWLGSQLGLSQPIMVTDGALFEHGLLGLTQNLGDRYLVVLDYRLEPMAKVMVLIHELAHAVHWDRGGTDWGHGPGWGEAYAEVFRLWVGEPSVQDE